MSEYSFRSQQSELLIEYKTNKNCALHGSHFQEKKTFKKENLIIQNYQKNIGKKVLPCPPLPYPPQCTCPFSHLQ